MSFVRRRILTLAAASALFAACEPIAQPGLGPDVRRGLDRGRDAAIAWIALGRAGDSVETETAIALGYLERLRIGLGSPFRLIEYALADPRLSDSVRVDLGWALFARTVDRLAYQIDPAALDRLGAGGVRTLPELGGHHMRLIDDAIRESADPRAGELAVRIAYALGSAEGSLSESAPALAARAAALLRDRELARDDALRLLRAAQSEHRSPFELLREWRAERGFQVEQPPLAPLPMAAELAALELAPALAGSLRELALRIEQIRQPASVPRSRSLLTPAVARVLRAAVDSLDPPPQAPVAIAARSYRAELLQPSRLDDEERERRVRFIEGAVSEERFVLEHALLSPAGREPAIALAALAAAVGMRSYAQEPVWYPGFGGPTTREIEERYGLAAVRFSDAVPAGWRPYYRRLLDLALGDLYRVLPALELRGLRVEFSSDEPGQEGTLALHDPKGRRLLLPPETAAGTIAHEIAHDLDWQIALRRYRVRGDYASDRASRSGTDRLALQLQDLAGGSLAHESPEERIAAHARRPAEVFARNIDWFVAVSLAAQGRINGYLSSVQDDVLTGYGTVRPPDVTGTAGTALVQILDQVAPVYPATRQSFLNSYGRFRSLTPYDLIRAVLGADPAGSAEDGQAYSFAAQGPAEVQAAFEEIGRAREAGFAAIDAWVCRSPATPYQRQLEAARRRLVVEAAASRARGLAVRLARETAGSAGARWTTFRLLGAPWPRVQLDSTTVSVLKPLTEHARLAAQADFDTGAAGFAGLISPPDRCGTRLPFGS